MCRNMFYNNFQQFYPNHKSAFNTCSLMQTYIPPNTLNCLCVIQWLNTACLDYDAHLSLKVISSIRLQYTHTITVHSNLAAIFTILDMLFLWYHHVTHCSIMVVCKNHAYKLINNSHTPAKSIVGHGKYNSPSLEFHTDTHSMHITERLKTHRHTFTS